MSDVEQIADKVLKLDTELVKAPSTMSVQNLEKHVKKCHEKATEAYAEMVTQAVRCGWYLIQLKDRVGHGQFIKAVEDKVGMGRTMSHSYMVIAAKWQWLPLPTKKQIMAECKSFRQLLTAVKLNDAPQQRMLKAKFESKRKHEDECEARGCVVRDTAVIRRCPDHLVEAVLELMADFDREALADIQQRSTELLEQASEEGRTK
jgi:hypothetical protein